MKNWVEDNKILECLVGSHAYGFANSESDEDIRGITIPPIRYAIGFGGVNFEQQEFPNEDKVIYGLKKYMQLAAQCNPNILDYIYVPERCIRFINEYGKKLIVNRDIFLSTKARHTFSGYAFEQLNRIKRHKKWIDDPPEKPNPNDYHFIRYMVLNERDGHNMPTKVAKDIYDNFPGQVKWIEQGTAPEYEVDLKHYNQYLEWKKNRNPKRAELEEKWGYDCYDDETTEFLTNRGWLKYDDVKKNDKLATVVIKDGSLKFDKFINRTDKVYNGYMYVIEPYLSKAIVTEKHNLLVSSAHRSKKNNFSMKYYSNESDWKLMPVIDCINGRRSMFHVMRSPVVNNADYDVDDEYLLLSGLFISEGSVQFKNNKFHNIRLSQKKSGTFFKFMDRLEKFYKISKHPYDKETVWTMHGDVARRLYKDFGHGSHKKRLPTWCLKLSKRQVDIMWDGLMSGDGFNDIKNDRDVYYTCNSDLAGDIQAMLVLSGIPCCDNGPYENKTPYGIVNMHQVIRGKNSNRIHHINFSTMLKYGQSIEAKKGHPVKQIKVENKRVVCFEVPEGTLITRNNGKIAIHGNCKHATHLVRLLRMGIEILTEGKVIVDRNEAGDAEELIQIRNGYMKYEDVVAYAEEQDGVLNDLYKTSSLPHSVDMMKIEELYVGIICDKFGLTWDPKFKFDED